MKLTKRLLSILLSALLMISCVVSSNIQVFADETETEENYGLEIDTDEKAESYVYDENLNAEDFAERYDPREMGYLTPVEVQKGGTCWMYATTAAAEQYVSYNYGSKFDISEAHGVVALSNSININNYSSGYYTNNAADGGTQGKAFQYFTHWNAPIYYNDTCDWQSCVLDSQFSSGKLQIGKPTGIDNDFLTAKSAFNVSGTKYIVKTEDNIKTAILKYGAVLADFYLKNSDVYNNGNCITYYYSDKHVTLNHTVAIVGWDDNFSKDNFKEGKRPAGDGAWLIRNSNWSGEYIWVSYYEGSFYSSYAHMSVITDAQKASNNEYMLSYDYHNLSKSFPLNSTTYLCNVFDLSDYDDYDEIKKVMFYIFVKGYDVTTEKCNNNIGICDYEVKILPVDSSGNVATDYLNYKSLASGQYSGEGYLTVDLNTPYNIGTVQKCAVVVKLTPANNQTAVEIPYTIFHPEAAGNTSFVGTSQNNVVTWSDEWYSSIKKNTSGNIVIRPILSKTNIVENEITVFPTDIIPDNNNVDIAVSSMDTLFNIHTRSGAILRQDIDYERTSSGITLYSDFIDSLNGNYTELVLEFNNDTTKSLFVNPKSVITEVNISGKTIVGDTLTATCVGTPEKDSYDVDYCWQYSINGTNWQNIWGADSSQYVIDENLFARYIRVIVTPKKYGNVSQGYTSERTATKVVILGDVDLDGQVTEADVLLLSQYLAEMVELNAEQMLAADVHPDGRISIWDVTEIQRMLSSKNQ